MSIPDPNPDFSPSRIQVLKKYRIPIRIRNTAPDLHELYRLLNSLGW